jgi:hypothetical protein
MVISTPDVTRLRLAGQGIAPGWSRISARRSGKRPMLIVGRMLLEARSRNTAAAVMHRIAVIETSDGGFAYTIEQQVKDAGTSFAAADVCGSFAEVVEALNGFDPTRGVCLEVDLDAGAGARVSHVFAQGEAARQDYQETLAQIVETTDARP